MVSMTETVSLSDWSLKTAVNITSYSVEGLRLVRMYLLSLPLKTNYKTETHKSHLTIYSIYINNIFPPKKINPER